MHQAKVNPCRDCDVEGSWWEVQGSENTTPRLLVEIAGVRGEAVFEADLESRCSLSGFRPGSWAQGRQNLFCLGHVRCHYFGNQRDENNGTATACVVFIFPRSAICGAGGDFGHQDGSAGDSCEVTPSWLSNYNARIDIDVIILVCRRDRGSVFSRPSM